MEARPGRIKDYIATPKPNLYQSLHTTVVTNFGQPFEIQIRTEEMHRTAEYGIAAHWKYKESRDEETSLDARIAWIREVMELQGGLKDSKEFMETVKGELYSTELLVFTPQSKVISLPAGATPVDFAYAIHSEVGNQAARGRKCEREDRPAEHRSWNRGTWWRSLPRRTARALRATG